MSGKLIVIGTPIGNISDTSPRVTETLGSVELLLVEDTRRTRKLLSLLGVRCPKLMVVNKHSENSVIEPALQHLRDGGQVGLVSDAGMPGVSDPGLGVVDAVLDAGFEVDVAPGPTAVSSALVLSGFTGKDFYFGGFLDRKGVGRKAQLDLIASMQCRVILFESPNRVDATLRDLSERSLGQRQVAVIREITKLHQQIFRGSIDNVLKDLPATLKGEVVIVLGGGLGRTEVTEPEILESLQDHLAAGMSARDAVLATAEELQVAKNRVYSVQKSL